MAINYLINPARNCQAGRAVAGRAHRWGGTRGQWNDSSSLKARRRRFAVRTGLELCQEW